MQVLRPNHPVDFEGLDPSRWVRKRRNHDLSLKTAEPLRSLDGTPDDPWWWDGTRWHFTPNPRWEAAAREYNRRYQLYMECRPF